MMRITRILSYSFLIISLAACSILGNNYYSLRAKSSIATSSFYEKQDFKFNFNIITIPVKIKGKTYEFIFDTGASNSIISREASEELGLSKKSTTNTTDSRNKSQSMDLVLIDTVSIAGVKFTGISANVVDWPDYSAVECLGKDGLIGNNLIRECNWIVDYENQMLILTDSALTTGSMTYKTQMLYPKSRPRFDLKLDTFSFESVLLDLGSGGGLDIGKNLVSKSDIPLDSYQIAKEVDGTSQGLFGSSIDTTLNIKVDSLIIGGFTIQNPPIDIETKQGAKIGNQILKKSVLYLDYDKNLIGFKPYKDTTSMAYTKSFGIATSLNDSGFYASSILLGSEAYKQGYRQGDKILELNGKKPSDFPDYCSYLFYLKDISKNPDPLRLVFKAQPDQEIKFEKASIWVD